MGCLLWHKWNGCVCQKCGEKRNEGHRYQQVEGHCESRCSICGDVQPIDHVWDNCKCTQCGKTRDTDHKFTPVEGRCEIMCAVCGKVQSTKHTWEGCVCTRCGETRDAEHLFGSVNGQCSERCGVCGREREKYTWIKGKCAQCGVEIASLTSLKTIKLSSIIQINERGVLYAVFSYALKNWGQPQEEAEIKKLLGKINNDDDLLKNDVVLLNRVFSLMLKLFPNNKELHIENMYLLRDIVNNMV